MGQMGMMGHMGMMNPFYSGIKKAQKKSKTFYKEAEENKEKEVKNE